MGEAGAEVSGAIREERKSLDRTDYVDEADAGSITAITGSVVTLAPGNSPEVGDALVQGAVTVIVTAVDFSGGSYHVTVYPTASAASLTVAAATLYKSYEVSLKWAPLTLGGPRQMKTWRDVAFHFRDYLAAFMEATFDTEENITEATRSIKESASYDPAGQPTAGLRNRRVEVADNHRAAAMLRVGVTIREAYAQWALHGFTIDYELAGTGSRS